MSLLFDFEKDKSWSDRFIPEIKQILGNLFISTAPEKDDLERNTDLMVFRSGRVRIAARMRRFEYFERYPDEFTIRYSRASGTKTEIDKIMEGWGDYIFYGFSDKEDESIYAYTVADLNVFRKSFWQSIKRQGEIPGELNKVKQNKCCFRAFKWGDFPKEMMLEQRTIKAA